MAYNQNNNRRNPKNKQRNNGRSNNYFEQEIAKFGKDFLNSKNAKNIMLDTDRIFRDLVRGNIDVIHYEEYLSDPMLLEACLVQSYNKMNFHGISHQGVLSYIQSTGMGTTEVTSVAEDHRIKKEVYTIIYSGFLNFKYSRNIEILLPMVNQLLNYKFSI
jgi:hypothetical protein